MYYCMIPAQSQQHNNERFHAIAVVDNSMENL